MRWLIELYNRVFKKYKLHDIFTPSTVAKVNYLRRDELEKRIITSLETPGEQIILYGHSGSGKTTIIRKLLGDKKYKFINIGNCEVQYGSKAVYADINGNFIASFDGYVTTFTVPDNPSIAYIYLSNGGNFPDNDNKQLELSKMEPVIE